MDFRRLYIPGDIDKEPELRDRIMVFAYMEELATLGHEISLHEGDEFAPPLHGSVTKVFEEKHTMELTLSRALAGHITPKTALTMCFPLDGQRFRSQVKFLERTTYLHALFEIPMVVRHGERRAMLRVNFGPRERANVTLLESLFQGRGGKGRVVNLSIGGVGVRLDTAILVQNQKRLALSPDLFQIGSKLDFLRISDLPHVPTLECQGEVAHIARTPMGIIMGIRFVGMDSLDVQLVNQVVFQRAPAAPRGFPVRYPKSRRIAAEQATGTATSKDSADAASDERWEDLPDEGDISLPESAAQPSEAESGTQDSKARLLQIKKRGKQIFILMLDDLDRMILAGTLQADGFHRIGEARNYMEAITWLKTHVPDLVIVDHHVGLHTAQQMIEKLRQQGFLEKTPIIMLALPGDVRASIQAKAAHLDRLVTYPINYDGEVRAILMQLLGL